MIDKEHIEGIFFLTWLVLGGAGLYLFFINRNAAFKRLVFPWFNVLVAFLFLFFIALLDTPRGAYVIVIPMMVLTTFLNIYRTKFCDACGRTAYNYGGFGRPKECSKCGSRLA
jgi:hypothetical protein